MSSIYCARQDVYNLGLGPEAFARPPRLVENVNPASGFLILRSHGLLLAGPVVFSVESSSTLGAAPAALPAGLSMGPAYYALPQGSDSFQVSATPNGSPIAFSDVGSGSYGVIVDHGPYLDAAIVDASSIMDEHLVSYFPPVTAAALAGVCARLARTIYTAAHAANNPNFTAAYKSPTIEMLRAIDDRLLAKWMSGEEVARGGTDSTPKIAEMGPTAVPLQGRGFTGHRERTELV